MIKHEDEEGVRMALLDSEQLVKELNKRFSQPLPEFYERRIIVWYDEEREFSDQLDEIVLDDAKLVTLTGTNNFQVKKLLALDDTTSNILLYNPISYERLEDNWLLDVQLYSEEFRADLISMWMDDMNLVQTPVLRKQVKKYKKFFNAQKRRNKIAKLEGSIEDPRQLDMAVLASIAGIKELNMKPLLRMLLSEGLETEENAVYQDFRSYEIDDTFWMFMKNGYGYEIENPTLIGLFAHILLTAATKSIHMDYLSGLEGMISLPHQANCYDFISEWIHSDMLNQMREAVEVIEEEMRIPARFMKLEIEDLVDVEVFPCVNEIILQKLMTDIGNHIIDVDKIVSIVEKRRTYIWYDEVKHFYDGLLQVAHMQAFYLNHTNGFHKADPQNIWKEYTTDYYVMDTYYRLFHKSFADSLRVYSTSLQDLFNQVKDRVENLYTNWFLNLLGENWTNVCEENLREYGYIMDVPKQTDFYQDKVENAKNRIFVIVSDAFRYELAVTLTAQLKRETQSEVKLSSMQGIFPTVTKFGMAALLPHKEITAQVKSTTKTERLAVLNDGESTEANNREKLLKRENPNSVVLKYKEILPMKRKERQELVKGKEVIYIYHDKVDHASHTDETTVFQACDDAIDEIKNLIRIIVNEFSGTNVIVTADHGFLYTYSPLKEDSKVDKTTDSSMDIEYGRRYAIMKADAKPDYLMKVKFLESDEGYQVFVPRENTRIKMSGAGLNFVHGGASLQEMVVPVVEYHNLRNDSKEYKRNKSKYDTKSVAVQLLSASHKISNMIFALNFYQKEAVSDNREACTYQVYFTDCNGMKISDVQRIIADKTSENGQERIFRCSFNLKNQDFDSTELYYLLIVDEDGNQIDREEFQIDIAATVDDFGFF